MAGRGPRPKDPSRRARSNSGSAPQTILRFERAEQPELPEEIPWPERTIQWWAMWGESPQAEHFSRTDWDFLMTTALVHADVWAGNLDRVGELRVQVAKFGATMEDRARLRMQFAEADEADAKRPASSSEPQGAAARYGQVVQLVQQPEPDEPDAAVGE